MNDKVKNELAQIFKECASDYETVEEYFNDLEEHPCLYGYMGKLREMFDILNRLYERRVWYIKNQYVTDEFTILNHEDMWFVYNEKTHKYTPLLLPKVRNFIMHPNHVMFVNYDDTIIVIHDDDIVDTKLAKMGDKK